MSESDAQCKSCGGRFSQSFAERNCGFCAVCWPIEREPNEAIPQFDKEDPIESDPEMAWLIELVNEAAKEASIRELNDASESRGCGPMITDEMLQMDILPMGFCHRFWHCKQRILKERYDIDWKSPAELNPDSWYD